MRIPGWAPSWRGLAPALIFALGLPMVSAREASAQSWKGYGGDPQHTCIASVKSQAPQLIRWSIPVDDAPPFDGDDLFIHYASPLITSKNNVIVTTRTATGSFRINAVNGTTGKSIWTQPLTSDYILPPSNWIPTCGSTLSPDESKLVIPGPGGTIYVRSSPDAATGSVSQLAFYGLENYENNADALKADVFICTPITSDAAGNFYFGFVVPGSSSPIAGLKSGGLARVSANGEGSWVSASTASGDTTMQKVVYNCAPALSIDGQTVYVAVNNTASGAGGFGTGYLVALNSLTLAPEGSVRLKDIRTPTADALLPDDGSATPTVGPDGDVYFGVLESNIPNGNNDRGWLLHFSGDLKTSKVPGSFGWDDTASIVPANLVLSYKGKSTYLVLTKYNDYADFGIGKGQNRIAILDPNATQPYTPPGSSTPLKVMQEVLTVIGVTKNTAENLPGVREWCINSAAIDKYNRCAIINSEDGHVYRWSFDSNTLSPGLELAEATGEAYTPTVIGPDGAVYAINRAVLNCCVQKTVRRPPTTR